MEALSRPPRRRDTSSATLSRKLSTTHSFSATAKHAYDGVFSAPNRAPSSRSSGIDDYGEIFGGSRSSSIPVLDLPSLDESEVLVSNRSSKLDYSNIFGGFCNDDVALSYEQLFQKPSGAKNSPEEGCAAAKEVSSSSSSSPERLDEMKISKETQQVSIEEASSEPEDGMKQFNMSYHKTSQRNIEIKSGTTHIAQMHSTPGYTCFIDESSSLQKKTVSDEHPEKSQSQPVQSKVSPLSNLGANLVDNRRPHKRSMTADFKEIPKRNFSKEGYADFSSSLSDEEEVDLNATAAASVAALRKALETAQASIRIAKEIMERKGGTQRFEVKKKREEKIPSKDTLKNGDVSEKEKAKRYGKFVRDNENYKLGLAREHEAATASLINQETNRRAKEMQTTGDILGQTNRNKNSLEEACKVVEVRNTPQDNYTDNKPVATHKIHELEDIDKAGIYLKDEKLKGEHKSQTEESDSKRIDKAGIYLKDEKLKGEHKSQTEESDSKRIDKAGIYLKDEKLKGEHKSQTEESDSKRIDKAGIYLKDEKLKGEHKLQTEESDSKRIDKAGIYLKDEKLKGEHKSQTEESDSKRIDKAGIYLKDEKLKVEHKSQTEESDSKRIRELEVTDSVNPPDNKSVATYKVREQEENDKPEVSQDTIKMDKQEASPEESEPEINLCLPTEESDKTRVCEEVTKWAPDESENYTGSSLIATYEVHEMEGVPLNEEKTDKQEASFGPGRCEAEINTCLLLTAESSERGIIQAVDKIEKNEKLSSEEEGCERICKEPLQSEEMNNRESDENKNDFSSQEEYKESVEIGEMNNKESVEIEEMNNKESVEIEEMNNKESVEIEEMNNKESEENKKDFSSQEEYKESVEIEESEEFIDEEVKLDSSKENFSPEILEKENIVMDSKDGNDEEDLQESRLKATSELKGVWKNRYLSSWWGAISEAITSKESNDNESESTGAGALKGVWKSRYLASEWGANKEACDVEVKEKEKEKEKENNEIENGLKNKLKGTTCELKGVWKTRYLASDWGAIKESHSLTDESEKISDPDETGRKEEENKNNQNHDTEESETSVGDESDDVDESEAVFAKIHKFKETVTRHGDGEDPEKALLRHNVSTETENLENAHDAFTNHMKAFIDETLSEENGSGSNVANKLVEQNNLEAAAKIEDRGPQNDDKPEEIDSTNASKKNQTLQNEDDSDVSSSSRDDRSYESFSEETVPKMEESRENQKLLGDEAKEVKEGKEEHVRRKAEMEQKNRDRIVVERAIREARERAFTDVRERAERAAVERATAEVRQRAMAEAREKIEKSKSFTGNKANVEARIRAERAAVERATSEARERAREKVALSQKATSSRESAANNDQQATDINNGESAQRRKARQERHQRTMERAAKALAEKNQRDLKSQKEQAERNRFAETLDAEVKRWSSGKEGNLRALLSTLQYILGPESGWQPVSLTEIITTAAVKKSYRRANLHVHPDKLQQRGASIQQKYICEKVFDLLKAAWNKFNSEER
ncbi:auxilin-like protein 1 isoform X2 [Impatiens glandulifera]|uniref:auxilin-like protein 1 isoform X2 n=1 Tax=Impatiens glandulifera TaxID=253017 RepID=UPI001FB0F8B8|nr:auxilin-like protein 1 isoform X2 [Impatiens glandulifera]